MFEVFPFVMIYMQVVTQSWLVSLLDLIKSLSCYSCT